MYSVIDGLLLPCILYRIKTKLAVQNSCNVLGLHHGCLAEYEKLRHSSRVLFPFRVRVHVNDKSVLHTPFTSTTRHKVINMAVSDWLTAPLRFRPVQVSIFTLLVYGLVFLSVLVNDQTPDVSDNLNGLNLTQTYEDLHQVCR